VVITLARVDLWADNSALVEHRWCSS